MRVILILAEMKMMYYVIDIQQSDGGEIEMPARLPPPPMLSCHVYSPMPPIVIATTPIRHACRHAAIVIAYAR